MDDTNPAATQRRRRRSSISSSSQKSRRRSLRTLQPLDNTFHLQQQQLGSVWVDYNTPSPDKTKCGRQRRSISGQSAGVRSGLVTTTTTTTAATSTTDSNKSNNDNFYRADCCWDKENIPGLTSTPVRCVLPLTNSSSNNNNNCSNRSSNHNISSNNINSSNSNNNRSSINNISSNSNRDASNTNIIITSSSLGCCSETADPEIPCEVPINSAPQECLIDVISAMCIEDSSKGGCHHRRYQSWYVDKSPNSSSSEGSESPLLKLYGKRKNNHYSTGESVSECALDNSRYSVGDGPALDNSCYSEGEELPLKFYIEERNKYYKTGDYRNSGESSSSNASRYSESKELPLNASRYSESKELSSNTSCYSESEELPLKFFIDKSKKHYQSPGCENSEESLGSKYECYVCNKSQGFDGETENLQNASLANMENGSPSMEETSLHLYLDVSNDDHDDIDPLFYQSSCSTPRSIEYNRADYFNVSPGNSMRLKSLSNGNLEKNVSMIDSAVFHHRDHSELLRKSCSPRGDGGGVTWDSFHNSCCSTSTLSLNTSSLSDLLPIPSDSWCFLPHYPDRDTDATSSNTLSESQLWNTSMESELSSSWCFASQRLLGQLGNSSTPRRSHKKPLGAVSSEGTLSVLESKISPQRMGNLAGNPACIPKGMLAHRLPPLPALATIASPQQSTKIYFSPTTSIQTCEENVSSMVEVVVRSGRDLPAQVEEGRVVVEPSPRMTAPPANKGLESLMNNLNLDSNKISPKQALASLNPGLEACEDSLQLTKPATKTKAKKSKSKVLGSRSAADGEVALAKRKKFRRCSFYINSEELIKDTDTPDDSRTFQGSDNSLVPGLEPVEKNVKATALKARSLRVRKSVGQCSSTVSEDVVNMECSKVKPRRASSQSNSPVSDAVTSIEHDNERSKAPAPTKPAKGPNKTGAKTQRKARKSVDASNRAQNVTKPQSEGKRGRKSSVKSSKEHICVEDIEMVSSKDYSVGTTTLRRYSKRKSFEVSMRLCKEQLLEESDVTSPTVEGDGIAVDGDDDNAVSDDDDDDATLMELYLQKNYKSITPSHLETVFESWNKRGGYCSKKKVLRSLTFEANLTKLKSRRKKALRIWPCMLETLEAAYNRTCVFPEEE